MPRPKRDRVLPHLLKAQLALSDDEDAFLARLIEQAVLHRAATIASGLPRSSAPPTDPRIARAVAHLHQNISDRRMTVADLAGVAAMSPWHFARTFRDVMGAPPQAYVRERRIEVAKEMLAHRASMTLASVALAAGFASQAHFTTALKGATGLTPGQIRKRAAQQQGAVDE